MILFPGSKSIDDFVNHERLAKVTGYRVKVQGDIIHTETSSTCTSVGFGKRTNLALIRITKDKCYSTTDWRIFDFDYVSSSKLSLICMIKIKKKDQVEKIK